MTHSKWPDIILNSPWGRCILIPPRQNDDNEAAVLRSDPVVLKYLPFMPTSMTTEEWRVKREKAAKDDGTWNFHIHLTSDSNTESPSFAGQCGIKHIDPDHRAGELGILLSPRLHHAGIATEALFVLLSHGFEHPNLRLHRIQFITASDNVQMRGWFKNFGIEVEHRLRDAWSDGRGGWLDAVGYSILEHEWPDLKVRLEKWLDTRVLSRPRPDNV